MIVYGYSCRSASVDINPCSFGVGSSPNLSMVLRHRGMAWLHCEGESKTQRLHRGDFVLAVPWFKVC